MNIYAFTQPPSASYFYPAYISVNEDTAGDAVVSVRSTGSQMPQEIVLSHEQLLALAEALKSYVTSKAKP